LLKKHKMAPW